MPHDLWRIAVFLGRTPAEVAGRYCFIDYYAGSNLPMLCVNTVVRDCVFLQGKKCVLGDAKPGQCLFNPLARGITLDGRIDYIDLGKDCGSKDRIIKIKDWVGALVSEENDEIVRVWSEFSLRISRLFLAGTDLAIEENKRVFQDMVLQACYLKIDADATFFPQLKSAVEYVEEQLFQTYSIVIPDIEEIRRQVTEDGVDPSPARISE